MWKYKSQTLVSIVGLAVGFVCFAMATLWIRYEMSYDSFHANADRMYCVNQQRRSFGDMVSSFTPYPLAEYLKSVFPEIANATAVQSGNIDFKYEGVNHQDRILRSDSSFFNMFDVRIVEGNMDFVIPENKKMAITREKSLQLFGNESPVGKRITMNDRSFTEYEICAIVTGFPKHSNYQFDFIGAFDFIQTTATKGWNISNGYTLVELVSGIDMDAFEKKLNTHQVQSEGYTAVEKMTLTPLTEVRYTAPTVAIEVTFQHIIIFALAGSLLILCTLVNYLTLFLSRFRMRQREFALRTVYGASGRSLFAMLSVEFLLSLIAALLFGIVLIDIISPYFMTVSSTRLDLPSIYLESVIYIVGIIVAALTVFVLTLVLFRRRTLDSSIRDNKKILRKASIVIQLIVSIVFTFCTFIILKQMYYLHGSDLGFSFKNRGSIKIEITPDQIAVLNNKMKQIPEIKETLAEHAPVLPIFIKPLDHVSDWDGKQEDKYITIEFAVTSEQYAKFYEFKLIEGEFVRDDEDEKYVLINESAAKAFGWDKSVGKSFGSRVVKGVMKNIYNFSPTIAAQPVYYLRQNNSNILSKESCILFKYEGDWKTCIDKINKIVEEEFPNKYYEYHNTEEVYDKFLKSENTLLVILTIISLVCIIVCIFGFVSMVSLTCEERRKEIAIRKINGATIKDILDIFFKEHLTLLAVGAAIAFPAGYIIMKRWLQNYVIQTEISAWVYVAILLSLIMVIVVSVGGKVWRTSRENPINAIK
jgi:hypothetical protein